MWIGYLNSVCDAQYETHWRLYFGIQLVFQEFGDFQLQTFKAIDRQFQILTACLTRNGVNSAAE